MDHPATTEAAAIGAAAGSHILRSSGARTGGAKLASQVVGRIVQDITAAGWPVGQVIGSEPELLGRYGVSRAVLREAVRLLEHQQVARMRRGPGGGLVVTVPTIESAIDAVMVHLIYVRATVGDVYEARLAVEESVAELAAERLTEDALAQLRDLTKRESRGEVRDHRELHSLLAAITQNPGLEFFVDLLSRVTLLYAPESSTITLPVLTSSARAHAKIVESVIAGSESEARHRMHRHLEAEAEFMQRESPSELRLGVVFGVPAGATKLAESVARRLFAEVMRSGWKVGEPIGSETELMERYDISRAVLREAVRVLEHHQIARMRRGPGGGLFVDEPGADATTAAVALHLDRRGIRPRHLFEVRRIVEMAVLNRVVERLDGRATQSLLDVLEVERSTAREQFPVVGHDLHVVLAELSGNPVLTLLTDVLVHLSRSHGAMPDDASGPLPTEAVIETHGGIVEAIMARDLDLARHRMRRHLDALVHWVR
ncbi:MAG: FadR/GntR family transcriptional regulator [Acidimicrobiia bacterium]